MPTRRITTLLITALALSSTPVFAVDDTPAPAGIGAVLGTRGTNVAIIKISPDSPAAAQHELKVDDRIVAVAQGDQPSVQVKNLRQAVDLIRGPKDTTVKLTVFHGGDDLSEIHTLSFVRADLKEFSVWGDGKLLTNDVPAPDIEMFTLPDSKSEYLSDYAGKIVVLDFWATWCGPCQVKMAELQIIVSQHPEWKDRVIFISASVDDDKAAPAPRLKARHWNQTHNVWVDAIPRRNYHINAIPTTYIIDAQQKIAAVNPGNIPAAVERLLHPPAKPAP